MNKSYDSRNPPKKFVGSDNRFLTLVDLSVPVKRAESHLKYFDKQTFEFVGEVELVEVQDRYLKKIFGLDVGDPLLKSYSVGTRQKKYMERLSDMEIDLDKYDYFMEC
ncbi:MAG: hypothetical protein L3J46_00840 [Kangiellaceae bacterium]|nr:hypothetical protein [Kangiellaceae bacterium]